MVNLQIINDMDENMARLRGFGVLLGSNCIRDNLPQEESSGLEYIYMDIVQHFEAIRSAMNRNR